MSAAMKLGILFVLIPTAFAMARASSVQIWLAKSQESLMNFIHNPTRQSSIPQFILDARHPWIIANQRKLERLPNVQAFLCSKLDSKDLMPDEGSKTLERFEIPDDLFHNLEIDNNRYGVSRPGWTNALLRLREMKECPRALEQAKSLHLDISVHEEKYSDLFLKALEMARPSEELLTIFGDVLESMISLETLKWKIGKGYTHLFEEAFKARNLTLPSIKHLEPGPFSHYLVSMCPNLERLENGGGYDWYHDFTPDRRDNWGLMLIQAATSRPKLKRFAMIGVESFDGWTPSLTSEVMKCMPQIESLGLRGSLGRDYGYGSGHWHENSGKLEAIVELLSGLENLTHLDLPSAHSLGLGFEGGPGCGNVYFGKSGRAYGRQVAREGAETTEKGAAIVLEHLPHLKSFRIGGNCANITKTEGGTVKVTWPWTGRMDEWLMEVWPEPEIEEPWEIEYDAMRTIVEIPEEVMDEMDADLH